MYKFGTIVLIPFPFTDLSSAKLRPALIVSKVQPKQSDLIVAFITSKRPKTLHSGQFLISQKSSYFSATGLKTESVLHFDKLATLDKRLILGELGHVEKSILESMRKVFEAVFGF